MNKEAYAFSIPNEILFYIFFFISNNLLPPQLTSSIFVYILKKNLSKNVMEKPGEKKPPI